MAVKLSSYLWFRMEINGLLDNPRHMNYPGFSADDVKVLRFIIDEVDNLNGINRKVSENSQPIIGPNVVLSGYIEFKEGTTMPERTASLYEGFHVVLQKYSIKAGLYGRLERCFDELNLPIKEDTMEAIAYAKKKCDRTTYGSLETMCWQTIREHKEKFPTSA